MKKQKVRALFISDVHLGLKKAKVTQLLTLLDTYEADTYVLVGDIIDLWKLSSSVYWPRSHNDIVRRFMKLARKSTVVYIPGNHDELLRDFVGEDIGGIKICREFFYETVGGSSVICLHGDQFDQVILKARWLAILGSWAYDALLELNEINIKFRRILGLRPWSLSMYLKHKAKQATGLMKNFVQAAVLYAEHKSCKAVVTGHIHKPEITHIGGIMYVNCGDWIENCSAVVEHKNGDWEIVYAEGCK